MPRRGNPPLGGLFNWVKKDPPELGLIPKDETAQEGGGGTWQGQAGLEPAFFCFRYCCSTTELFGGTLSVRPKTGVQVLGRYLKHPIENATVPAGLEPAFCEPTLRCLLPLS